MLKIWLLFILLVVYLLGFFCYYKINVPEIERAKFANKKRNFFFLRLFIEYLVIAYILSGITCLILTKWSALN